jgi:hypothetical protein
LFVPGNGVRVFVEGGGIRHVAAGIVRYNRDVIAYLLILRETCLRIERIAHLDVRGPGCAAIGTPGIEQLRLNVVGGVSRVIPHHINASIGRHRKCAKKVPLVMVNRVVIDPMRRAKGLAAIGAASEHHVSAVASAKRYHTGKHVNVIVCAGTIHCDERLPAKSYSIDATLNKIATKVDRNVLIETWRDLWVLCV